MAGMFRRRSALTAAAAAVATIVTPFAGAAIGAPSAAFAGTGVTTKPAPDSNNVVHANRPQVIANFTDNLASTSTISLTAKGSTNNLCNAFDVSGTQVSCTPTADLDLGTTYEAVGHGVSQSGAKADTKPFDFTVDYPKFDDKNSDPAPGNSVVSGSEPITAKFSEQVTGNKDTTAPDGAFKVFQVNADGSRGTQLPGTVAFPAPATPASSSPDNVTFTGSMVSGKYEAVVLVHGVDSSGKENPAATGTADYYFYIDTSAPDHLQSSAPNNTANTQNSAKFPLSGTAAPGLTVNVAVPNSADPTGLEDASGSTTVATCDAAPVCPWTATVDVSGFNNTTAQKWTAQAVDPAGKKSPVGQGAPFVINQESVTAPKVTSPNDGDKVSHTVTVAATDQSTAPSNVTQYHVTITDPENNTIVQDIPADASHNLPATSINLDSLDDGTLTVLIQAEDAVGNVSPPPNPLNPQDTPSPQVTKTTGFFPQLDTSTLTSDAGDTTFTQAITQDVRPVTTVTVRFAQTVTLGYTDNSNPTASKTHSSSLCVATPQGNCLYSATPTLTDDKHGLVIKLSKPVPEGTYSVRGTTYSAGLCPDVNPGGSDTCASNGGVWSGQVMNGSAPFTFTVDSTPPTVVVSKISPNPITASGASNVTVSGTVSSDVDTSKGVSLVLKSSGSKTPRQVPAQLGQTASGSTSWSATGIDLSQMPDGTLTVTATAFDQAGNKGTGKATAALRAHLSSLTVAASHKRIHAGHAVTLAGRLRDQFGDAITSATITVQPRYAGGKLGQPNTAVTDSSGRWSLLEAPKHSATFFAYYAGTKTSPVHDATLGKARVGVHVNLVITSPTKGSVSSPVKVHGKVSPHKRGATVKLYRKTNHGWSLVGKHKLNHHSRFTIKVSLPHGTQQLKAKIGKTTGNLGDTSQHITLHVH